MLNMIKMDLYRMFRTKSLYIIWIIMAVVLIYTTKLSVLDYETIQQSGQEMSEETTNINLGMSVMIPTEPGQEVTVYDVMFANTSAKFLGLFLVIFAVIFSTADMNSGYVKSIAGQVRNRGNLIISRALVLMLFTVLTLLGSSIVQMVSNQFVFGNLDLGSIKDFVMYMGTQTLLHFALVLIVMSIAVILKNNVASMVIAICLTMNVMMILYSGIDKVAERFGIKEFNMIKYTVTGRISLLPMEMKSKDCLEGTVIAVVFILVSTLLASFIFKKRDI